MWGVAKMYTHQRENHAALIVQGVYNMKILLYILSIFFLLLGVYGIICNWIGFWLAYVKKQHIGSFAPLVAGVLVMVGLLLFPNNDVRKLCWIGFLIDWGSIPGIFCSVWRIHKDKHK